MPHGDARSRQETVVRQSRSWILRDYRFISRSTFLDGRTPSQGEGRAIRSSGNASPAPAAKPRHVMQADAGRGHASEGYTPNHARSARHTWVDQHALIMMGA